MVGDISFSGVSTDIKNELCEAAKLMGKDVIGTMSTKTTHLIISSKNIGETEKYNKAIKYDMKIVLPAWLIDSSKALKWLPEHDYPVPCFHGLVMATTGLSTEEKDELGLLIIKEEGSIEIDLKPNYFCLVGIEPVGHKWRFAKEHNIPVVVPDWIRQCVERNVRLPFDGYLVQEKSSINLMNELSYEDDQDDTENSSVWSLEGVKESSCFSGCIVHLTGFDTQDELKIAMFLLRYGMGTRCRSNDEDMTHIVIGKDQESKREEIETTFSKRGVAVVTKQWLLQSAKRQTMLNPSHFSLMSTTTTITSSPKMNPTAATSISSTTMTTSSKIPTRTVTHLSQRKDDERGKTLLSQKDKSKDGSFKEKGNESSSQGIKRSQIFKDDILLLHHTEPNASRYAESIRRRGGEAFLFGNIELNDKIKLMISKLILEENVQVRTKQINDRLTRGQNGGHGSGGGGNKVNSSHGYYESQTLFRMVVISDMFTINNDEFKQFEKEILEACRSQLNDRDLLKIPNKLQRASWLWVLFCVHSRFCQSSSRCSYTRHDLFQPRSWRIQLFNRSPLIKTNEEEDGHIQEKQKNKKQNKFVISLSLYTDVERAVLEYLVVQMKAELPKALNDQVTHLVCKWPTGDKYHKVLSEKSWNVKVVTCDWLLHCAQFGYSEGSEELFPLPQVKWIKNNSDDEKVTKNVKEMGSVPSQPPLIKNKNVEEVIVSTHNTIDHNHNNNHHQIPVEQEKLDINNVDNNRNEEEDPAHRVKAHENINHTDLLDVKRSRTMVDVDIENAQNLLKPYKDDDEEEDENVGGVVEGGTTMVKDVRTEVKNNEEDNISGSSQDNIDRADVMQEEEEEYGEEGVEDEVEVANDEVEAEVEVDINQDLDVDEEEDSLNESCFKISTHIFPRPRTRTAILETNTRKKSRVLAPQINEVESQVTMDENQYCESQVVTYR